MSGDDVRHRIGEFLEEIRGDRFDGAGGVTVTMTAGIATDVESVRGPLDMPKLMRSIRRAPPAGTVEPPVTRQASGEVSL
jgi:hypothetical protein